MIGIDYTPAYEQGGGIGRYVRELIAALAVQDQNTIYRLFVAGVNKQKPLPSAPNKNFSWRPSPITPEWYARLWHRAQIPIPVELWTGRVRLFHATDFVLPPTLPGTKTVLTVHDLSFVRVPGAANPSLKKYLDSVVPRSVERADHVLADSQATKDDLIDLYNVPSEKISVLLSGVNPRFMPGEVSPDVLKRYGITQPYIFAVGTVQPRKNYERLIRALAALPKALSHVHLVIAGGKGWLEAPIYAAVEELKVTDRVHFIGFADDADLPMLYQGSRMLAFPSLYEGFGLPILEAMACGTPVLTANVSSLLEVAGQAAILVDPNSVEAIREGLIHVLEDDHLHAQLREKGFKQAKEFTWERAAIQLQTLYQKMLL